MFRKAVVYTALACMLVAMPLGCHSRRSVPIEEIGTPSPYAGQTIRAVVTIEGEVIEFPRDHAPVLYTYTKVIIGMPNRRSRPTEGGGWTEPKAIPKSEREECRIPFEDVRTIYVEKWDALRSIVVVVAVTVVVVMVAAGVACSQMEPEFDLPDTAFTSCPLVHSFDGEHYVLEGIPYVGSMCEGLERTDVLRLEHLAPVENEYRLLVSNDAVETEYVDEFSLLVADHNPGVELVVDARGGVHTIREREEPLSARDQNGNDWHQWLRAKDLLFWEGDPFSMDPDGTGDLRDTLFFTFRVPHSASRAKLLVSGGHSTWASGIEYELLELWGPQVASFYEGCKDPDFRARFLRWVGREEFTSLAVRVRTSDGWRVADHVSPDNSAGSGEQVAIVDLKDVVGETLEVALAPPAGLWRVNAVTADFSEEVPFSLTEVAVSSVKGPGDEDATEALRADDGAYLVMPDKGMRAFLSFPVPKPVPGKERTLFARATGHYDIRFDARGPAQLEELERLEDEPGYAAVLALRYHRERWRGLAALVAR